MTKQTILLIFLLVLLASSVFAQDFGVLEKAAARQKIRPELLQAIDSFGREAGKVVPMKETRIASGAGSNVALNTNFVKANKGKIRVLVSTGQESDLADVGNGVVGAGGKVKGKFEAGNAVFAEVPLNKLEEIAASSEVEEIWPDFEVKAMEEPLEQINAESAWNLGLHGEGMKIAVLDTGIDETHPALQGKVIAAQDFSGTGNPQDFFGHGTHVAGIIAGTGQVQGVAPETMLLNGKVLDDNGNGTMSSVIAGINWAIEQKADVINLSLGAPIAEENTPLNQAIRDAIAQGIVVAVAAGNCGFGCASSSCNGFTGITMPGNTKEALTVGAVDAGNNAACFSGNGIVEGTIKPDVMAPGVAIVSSVPGGIEAKSGTSMATPFAAAAIALVMQQNPAFEPAEAKNFLEQTAFDLGKENEDSVYGWGLIDLSRMEEDLNSVPDENNWNPPETGEGTDVEFLDAAFTFSGPDTVYKLTEGSYSVWHEGTQGQEMNAEEEGYIDIIVEFVVLNEFGNVVDRYFRGPTEYTSGPPVSFDYTWMPERTGNFTVSATIYQEGIATSGVTANDIRASTAEKNVKVTVPEDMLQITVFNAPQEIEQGTSAQFVLGVQNNSYLDENAVAEIRLEDEAGNIFKLVSGEAQEITTGQAEEFTFNTPIELPDGNYNARALVFFEDRNVSTERETRVFFPANCSVQTPVIPATVEAGEMLQGTIVFENNTGLNAVPAFFGNVFDENESVEQVFFDGNIVEAGNTRQYGFAWEADSSPGSYVLKFESQYNGNVAEAEQGFVIEDTMAPEINSVSFQESVVQNEFNPIRATVYDFTGIAGVAANIMAPDGQEFSLELEQTGFDTNSEWNKAFAETAQTGLYTVEFEACDFYGNCSVPQEMAFTTGEMQAGCLERNVLLVASDTGFSFDANEFQWLEELEQGQQCMQLWKKSLHGNPDLDYLQKFDAVVWATENRFGESIDANDVRLLVDYVNAGGRLLLEGSDVASEHVSDELMQAVAKASWENEPYTDTNGSAIEFEQSGFITSMESTGFDFGKAPFFDTLAELEGEPLAYYGGQPVMSYGWDVNTGSKTVFSAIAFSALDEANRQEIATVSIEWLLEKVLFGSMLHLKEMPSYAKDENNYSGVAVAEMILDFVRQKAGYSDLNQQQIFEYAGLAGKDFNAEAMDAVLGHFDPYDVDVANNLDAYDRLYDGNPYQGYNYTVEAFDSATNPEAMNEYMRDIVHWMAYPVTREEWWRTEELVAVPNTPAAIPLYGSYGNWVALNGFAASGNPTPRPLENPWFVPKVTIYGFWLTDPNTSGIGSHVYVTAADANSLYFKPMDSNDSYNGKFLQIAEPPAERPIEGLLSTAGIKEQDNAIKVQGSKAIIAKPVPRPENLKVLQRIMGN